MNVVNDRQADYLAKSRLMISTRTKLTLLYFVAIASCVVSQCRDMYRCLLPSFVFKLKYGCQLLLSCQSVSQ